METAISNLAAPRAAGSVWRTRLFVVGFGLLLGLALPALLNVALPPTQLRNDMAALPPAVDTGYLDPLELGSGFYDPETAPSGTTFRWTGPHATLTFPYAANLGRYLHVSVSLAANRAAGQAPTDVTVSLNARPQAHFTATSDFQSHQFTLDTHDAPNPYLDPAHLQLDIQTSTVTNSGDPRQLGVAVDSIQAQAERDAGDLILEGAVWAVALLSLLLVATSRFSLPWSLLYGLAALSSFALVHATPVPRAIPVTIEVALAGLAWLIAASLAPRQQPVWGLGLAACGLWLVVAGRLLGDWQMDDAYISYRYAWNLAHGNGLIYNPGEAPVEGYTTFLWPILASAAIAVGLHPAGLMLAANIAFALGIVGLTYLLSTRLSGRTYPWPLLAALFLAIDPALLSYGARGSGMEMAAFAFFVMLAVALLWAERSAGAGKRLDKDDGRWTMDDGGKSSAILTPSSIVHRPSSAARRSSIVHFPRPLAGLCLALASLIRPEGLLVAAILLVIRAWQDRGADGARQAGRLALAALVPFLAIVGPYQVWRIAFYGYPFPNTFYAKTGATVALVERGLGHLWAFLGEHWLVAALAALGLALVFLKPQRKGAHLALAVLVVEYTLYIIWVGGDYFPGWRFFVPIIAPLTLLAQEGARIALGYLPSLPPVAGIGDRGYPLAGVGVGPPADPTPDPRPPTPASKAFPIRPAAAALLAVLAALYLRDALWLEGAGQPLAEETRLQAIYISRWGSAGLWLRDNTPPQTWTVAKGAGAIAYYSRRRVIDIFGLNDLHIGHLAIANMGEGKAGHEKQDPQYVLDHHPDYILAEWDPNFQPIKAQLKRDYEYLPARAPTGPTMDWWRLK